MRVAAWLGLALGSMAAPAFAKGPPWTHDLLAKPKRFGAMQLAAGEVALFSSGRAGYGTLASPLAVSTSLELPAGSVVVFLDEESPGAPYWPMGAAVPGIFSACGFELGPTDADDVPFLFSIGTPLGSTRIRFEYLSEAERRAHPDQVSLSGGLLRGMSAVGLDLPAGSQITVRCDQSGGTLLSFSGNFARDSEVGGVLLRAGEPAGVSFGVHGPSVTSGVLARPYELYARMLPVGTRLTIYDGLATAECGHGKTAVFFGGSWRTSDCGDALAPPEPASAAKPKPVPPARSRARKWLLLGSAQALLVALALAAWLRVTRRAKV